MTALRSAAKLASALTLAALIPATAMAGYYTWDTVTPAASTGASCGNGTPYRFFVNRTTNAANMAKTVIVFEGGGACWEQNACQMKDGVLGATNYKRIGNSTA